MNRAKLGFQCHHLIQIFIKFTYYKTFCLFFSPSLIHPAKYGLINLPKILLLTCDTFLQNPAVLIYFYVLERLCLQSPHGLSPPTYSVLFFQDRCSFSKLVSSLPFSYPLTLKFCQNKYLCFVHKCIPSTLYIPSGCSIIIYGLIPCSFTPQNSYNYLLMQHSSSSSTFLNLTDCFLTQVTLLPPIFC